MPMLPYNGEPMVFFQHMNASMNQALCVIEAMRAALLIRERTQSQSRPMTFSRETKVLFRKPFFRISSQIISMGFSWDIGQQRIQLDFFWNPQCSATVSGSVICKQQDVFVRICLGKLFEKHVHAPIPLPSIYTMDCQYESIQNLGRSGICAQLVYLWAIVALLIGGLCALMNVSCQASILLGANGFIA